MILDYKFHKSFFFLFLNTVSSQRITHKMGRREYFLHWNLRETVAFILGCKPILGQLFFRPAIPSGPYLELQFKANESG